MDTFPPGVRTGMTPPSAASQGAIFTDTGSGNQFKISYTGDSVGNTFLGGNDVVLQAIPEPSAWALATIGLTAATILRRRKG